MSTYQTISSYVNQRERAYTYTGTIGMARAKAISRLKQILDYIKGMPEPRQRNYLANYKEEIRLLLPPEKSRFQKLRQRIINLITQL